MLVLGSVLAVFFGASADAAGPLDAAIDTRVTTQKDAADSQERIDAVANQTHAMLLDFQHVSTSCRSSSGQGDGEFAAARVAPIEGLERGLQLDGDAERIEPGGR